MNDKNVSDKLPGLWMVIAALGLFRLFPVPLIGWALAFWVVSAGAVAALGVVRFELKPVKALVSVVLGMVLTLVLVAAFGLTRMKMDPSEIRGLFTEGPEIQLQGSARFEAKASLCHDEIEPGAHWAYRAFYVKVQDDARARYFYVFQHARDIPTEVRPVSRWLWLFPL